MRKLFFTVALVFATINANAQFFTGLAFDVNWRNDGSITSAGVDTKLNNAYSGDISPQFGYQFSSKFMVGGRLNFLFDKSYYTSTDENTQKTINYVQSSIGWDIAPFARYRIAAFGENDWFSIWADLHFYYGVKYPTNAQEAGYITKSFNRKYIYGIQAMPALGFRLNDHSTAFINFAILSLAYSGSCTNYDDRSEYENLVLLFTGKLRGLFSAIGSDGMYGVKFGIIRTF